MTPSIEDVAKTLKRDTDYLTVRAIESWLHVNITYRFFWYPRGTQTTWAEKTGDCTDMAQLAVQMLSFLKIPAKTMHGWGTFPWEKAPVKHDWCVARIRLIDPTTGGLSRESRDQICDGVYGCTKYQVIGDGVW